MDNKRFTLGLNDPSKKRKSVAETFQSIQSQLQPNTQK